MHKFEFEDLEFIDEKDRVKILFLRHFFFYIDKADLYRISSFKLGKNFIEFDTEEKRALKFYDLIDKGISELKSSITSKDAVYVHRGSKIPLIGNGSFGIVDRGTNLIEIKPVCGCNLDCIYCSVDEEKRMVDFVIEKDYLVDELKKVVEIKNNEVEVHIGCQGEPLLYAPLIQLVKDIKNIPKVKRISMDTNTTLLTPEMVDKLIDAGMTRFNLSINSLDRGLAKKLAGGGYSVAHAKRIAEYIAKKGVSLTIAPVFLDGLNNKDMEEIIKFAKKIGADVGIQNFLKYQFGKAPVKEISMEEFYGWLKELEKKYSVKLVLSAEDFGIKKDNSVKKPFKKGEVVEATIVSLGRLPSEMIAAAKQRSISVFGNSKKIGSEIRIKIKRAKHGIYAGQSL